uniref:HVA22-like protein n=1 Tax=Wollemia nobilis TaxID=56998 RepID=A0A0C9RQF9_9CONI
MGWGNFLKAVATNIDIFAGPVVTLLYPLYCSIRAIETPSRLDDQQWLTYWVLYSFITLFELTFAKILEWLPFWPYLKLIATCWLVLPLFNGAAYVYENYVRKMIINPKFDSRFNPIQRKVNINPSTRGVVERYIEENGQDAFDKLIRKAEKESKTSRFSRSDYDYDERYYDEY